jgi:hypothetical protein
MWHGRITGAHGLRLRVATYGCPAGAPQGPGGNGGAGIAGIAAAQGDFVAVASAYRAALGPSPQVGAQLVTVADNPRA